jgi:hypothetical protein
VTGEIDFIRARELVQMKAKLESINDQCDDLEPERGNNFLKEESEEIPLLLDTSKLVAWLMERISIRHNSKTCEDAIILQFEKDEEKAQDIIKNVEKLSGHLTRYEDYYQKLGNTLSTTVNHYNAGYKELNKIDKDVTKITGVVGAGMDVLTIDKPQKDDE